VASELSARGNTVLIPTPVDGGTPPFWPQQAAAAGIAVPRVDHLVLAAHGGAGPLLPAIVDAARCEVATYLFVDADLPAHGHSRLDLLRMMDLDKAARVDQHLRAGGTYPDLTDEVLRTLIPDEGARAAVLAEMRPRSRAFFLEPLPVPVGWPDAPAAYLRLSEEYETPAARAESLGWPVRRLEVSGHFHTVVDPAEVAAAMLELCDRK